MFNQLLLPLVLLFPNSPCDQRATRAEAIVAYREAGLPLERLTSFPVSAFVTGRINLSDTLSLVEELSRLYALPMTSWETRLIEYEKCLKEKEEGNGREELG